MEFSLIERYFQTPFLPLAKAMAERTQTGFGDDCFSLCPAEHESIFVSTDTLVSGVHFFAEDITPNNLENLGYKALAVNISDLAASGATPIAFSLNLSLPNHASFNVRAFCESFSKGLLQAAQTFHCALLGGDTTSLGEHIGPVISITAYGLAPKGHQGFHRAHARTGDEVWVSGVPGLALLGLLLELHQRGDVPALVKYAEKIAVLHEACVSAQWFSANIASELLQVQELASQPTPVMAFKTHHHANAFQAMLDLLHRIPEAVSAKALNALHRPKPRLDVSQALMQMLHSHDGHAKPHAAIDLSDGLSGDLLHIASLSQCGVTLNGQAFKQMWLEFWSESEKWLHVLLPISLLGGDDYQLAFTLQNHNIESARHLWGSRLPDDCRVVGVIEPVGLTVPAKGVFLQGINGKRYDLPSMSHQHFAQPSFVFDRINP